MIAGRYELEELVGTGGMSRVYRAHDRRLERLVALKVLHERLGADDEHVSRFRHEARAVAQLSHPNIVTVIDRGEDGGRRFIVFEYVDGENLKQLCERTGPLPVRRALEIAVAVADGLAYAHEHGVVHRDVKPQNVLLSRDGEVKVTDFGIARSLDAESGLTVTGTRARNEQLPLAGAGERTARDAGGRRLLPGSRPVRAAGRRGAVPGREPGRRRAEARERAAPEPAGLAARRARAARVGGRAGAARRIPERRFASMDDFAAELRACLAPGSSPRTRS